MFKLIRIITVTYSGVQNIISYNVTHFGYFYCSPPKAGNKRLLDFGIVFSDE